MLGFMVMTKTEVRGKDCNNNATETILITADTNCRLIELDVLLGTYEIV